MPVAKIEFTSPSVLTVTAEDGSVQTFTTAPVVTDEKIVVTHLDGSTEEFEPKQ